nr:hypothetical protein [Tanacetum cinerariifolium]
TALEHNTLSPSPQCQENVPHVAGIVTTSNELDLLFSPMFDELLNGSAQVVSKSSAVTTADALNQCQQQNTTPLITLTTHAPTVTSTENIDQAETIEENAQVEDDEFINIFCTPVQDRVETSDGEYLDKMKEKGDACIFVRYSTQSRAYRVFNKRTRMIMETIHVNFDELPQMASDHVSSDPVPECQRMVLEHNSLTGIVTTSNEMDLLFSPMFDELLNGSAQVVSKFFAVTTADALNQCQQQNTTPLITLTTPAPTVTSTENIDQAETIEENA